MTTHYRITEADCLVIGRTEHRLVQADAAGSIWARLDQDAVRLKFTDDEFVQLLSQADSRLMRDHFSDQRQRLRLRCDQRYLHTVPAPKRAKVLWKESCVRFFLQAEAAGETKRSSASVDRILPTIERRVNEAEESGQDVGRTPRAGQTFTRWRFPSSRSLLQWVRIYEAAGQTPLALLRKQRISGAGRMLLAETEGLLAACVTEFLDRSQPSQEEIVRRVGDRFAEANAAREAVGKPRLPAPSARTVRRRIAALDPFEVAAQRKGIEAARRKFGFYEEGLAADYPLQRVEMDEWRVDVATLLGDSGALDGLPSEERLRFEVGRRWVYVVMDCATRCILGFRIVATPNVDDAIRALQLVTVDRTPIAEAAGCKSPWNQAGGIGILVTDQGSAFASEAFRTAVIDLGSTYEAPPAGVPKLRARIERLFRTFGQQLAPILTGRTFSNPVERDDYPSEQWAALTDDELAEIFTQFIVDIYHNSIHSGLNRETPANAWKRLSAEQGVTPPPDANTRRVVFGLPHSRKLGRHGLRVVGINYSCQALQEAMLRGLAGEVQLRLDPEDLTHISVCLGHEWVVAEAVPHSVWGLSLVEWQAIVSNARTRFKAEAILNEDIIREARKRIRAVDARARQLRRIQPTQISKDALERAENELYLGLRIGPERSAATGDLEHPSGRRRPDAEDLLTDVIEADSLSQPVPEGAPELSDPGGEWSFDD